eukprot:TRINITY_DN85634_c0_g1_i1.p1 TRINITY_DN85634_c0_g1~~TRINITY_DN85634_c0_g1_i1.p1  ORF type:complete len:259 (+),score=24.49 TRINITY_DN85634_c0_g1_i1:1-777(+)
MKLKTGNLVWNKDDILDRQKGGVSLEEALLKCYIDTAHVKIDVYAPIAHIYMEVTTVLKFSTSFAHAAGSKQSRQKHIEVLHEDVHKERVVKSVKRLLVLHSIVDPWNTVFSYPVQRLEELFAEPPAALAQIAAFLNTLHKMSLSSLDQAKSAVCSPDRRRQSIDSIVAKLLSLHLHGVHDIDQDLLDEGRALVKLASRDNFCWDRVDSFKNRILDLSDQTANKWLERRGLNLKKLADAMLDQGKHNFQEGRHYLLLR